MNQLTELQILFMVAMLGGIGLYALYTAIRLAATYTLFPNKILYPGSHRPEDCVNPLGFIDYVLPRLWILAGVSIVLTVFLVLINLLHILQVPNWVSRYALPIAGLSVLVWYIVVNYRSAKKYW